MPKLLKITLAFAMVILAGGLCPAQIFNVKNYGAAGDGVTLDSPAVNAAIAAAGAAGGGTVWFPTGTYLCGSIHLTNNLTLYLSNNAVIWASQTNIDTHEANPYSAYQDPGHSYFQDALIWGENLKNLTFAGPGQINGHGALTTGNPSTTTPGDKALCLVMCSNVVITNISITAGGHFGILAQACTNMLVTGTQILESSYRDGFNLIDSSDVVITNCDIEGSDDSMCLKSDYALGRVVGASNIHVMNCTIFSTQNNATQFGSETVGSFRDVTFSNLKLTQAGKAGIGITSQDGAVIDGVTYDNITMSNCACPILLKLDLRTGQAGSPNPSVGRIRNISINNVVAVHSTSINTGISFRTNICTIDGFTSTTNIPIENITFNNVNVSTPGGSTVSAITNYPVQTDDWQPNTMVSWPCFGWYLRYANDISFTNCVMRFDTNDDRPAVVTDTVTNVLFSNCKADVGRNNINYGLGFLNTPGYEATNCVATTNAPATGAAMRIYNSNSAPALVVSPPYFSPGDGIYFTPQTVAIASGTPGVTIRYTTDGTTPTPTNGTIYSAPVIITNETILLAVAYLNGQTNSAVNTAIYNIPGTSLELASPPPSSPPPTNVTFAFEAESLPYVTNGAVAVLQNDANTSGGHWLALEATGIGQSIDYTVTNLPAGTYDLQMSWKGNTERGIISFTLDGTVLGSNLDQYTSSQTYPVTDYGIVTLTNNANHVIHLAVVGENPAGTGYWISTDQFIFTQLQAGLPQTPRISGVTWSGTSLNFSGTNGIPTLTYYLLASTNLAVPLTNWTVSASSTFDTNGDFTLPVVPGPGATQQFYRLKLPLLELP